MLDVDALYNNGHCNTSCYGFIYVVYAKFDIFKQQLFSEKSQCIEGIFQVANIFRASNKKKFLF